MFAESEIEPVQADAWIVSSLLQKSIRRRDAETAQRAALTLLAQKGSSVWRRLLVIAFEDVGAGSAGAVASATTACSDPVWRKRNGGNQGCAIKVARILAEAPKERSADYLICGSKDHPSLADVRRECESSSLTQRLNAVVDKGRPLTCGATIKVRIPRQSG